MIERAGTSGVGRQALHDGGESILAERFARRDPLYREVAVATLDLTNAPHSDAERLQELIVQL